MNRTDISPDLIHFTKGSSDELAFQTLKKILADGFLTGGNGWIRGGYNCVCFSEAPVTHIGGGLVNPSNYSRYSLFGISVSKKWLFSQGGRPVIYQPEEEYEYLPENNRWRHVRYDLRDGKEVDFTWEREWRIQCAQLPFNDQIAHVVVPNKTWEDKLVTELAQKPFPWEVKCLIEEG